MLNIQASSTSGLVASNLRQQWSGTNADDDPHTDVNYAPKINLDFLLLCVDSDYNIATDLDPITYFRLLLLISSSKSKYATTNLKSDFNQ